MPCSGRSRRLRRGARRRACIAAWKSMRVGIVLACAGGRAPASDRRRRRTTASSSPPCACSCGRPGRAGSTDGRSARCRPPRSAGPRRRRGSAPRNSGENSPWTVETWTPTFSKTRPCIIAMTPPPPSAPAWSVRCQGVAREAAGASRRDAKGAGGLVLERLEARRRSGRAAPRTRRRRASALAVRVDGLGLGQALGSSTAPAMRTVGRGRESPAKAAGLP